MTDAHTGHLDLDALADVLAGERPDDAHLRSCGPCADRLAELATAEVAVRASLASLPAPALPDGLAERLSAALQQEAERAARDRPPRPEPAASRVVPLRRRAPAWLPAVAASLVLVVAGAVGFSALRGPGSGADSATTAAGGGSEAEREQADDGGSAGSALSAPAPVSSATGTDWAREDLRAAALPQVLAGTGTGAVPDSTPDALERLRDPAALAECLAALPAGATGAQTLAVDYARFAGDPALAVVQDDGGAGGLLLTVVGADCAAARAEPLLRTRVPVP